MNVALWEIDVTLLTKYITNNCENVKNGFYENNTSIVFRSFHNICLFFNLCIRILKCIYRIAT